MKKMFLVLTSILSAVTCFGATNWSKSVQMDQNYVLLNRSNIVLSNTLAVAAGDLTSTTSASTVVGLRGKSIPLPGAGDGGKAYVYNSGLGVFELQTVGGATPTLAQVTAAGSNTTENLSLRGSWNSISKNTAPYYEDFTGASGGLNLGLNGSAGGGRTNQGNANINMGVISGKQHHLTGASGSINGGTLNSSGFQENTGWGNINWGGYSGSRQVSSGRGNLQWLSGAMIANAQLASGRGGLNWGYFNGVSTEYQTNTAYGAWGVGRNTKATHDYSYIFGNGLDSVDTNAVHAHQFYAQGRIMPYASNTVDIGSAALPFRHGYFGDASLYLGDYQVTKAKAQNYDTAYSWGDHALAGYMKSPTAHIAITNGIGVTSFVAQAVAGLTDTKTTVAGNGAGASLASGGLENTLYGFNAGALLASGDYNVAIGVDAMASNSTRSINVAIGHGALRDLTGESKNVAIGAGALEMMNTGKNNVYVGTDVGTWATNAQYNVVIGHETARSCQGKYNTIIGNRAAGPSGGSGSLSEYTNNYNCILLGSEAIPSSGNAIGEFVAGSVGYPIDDIYYRSTGGQATRIRTPIQMVQNLIVTNVYPVASNVVDIGSQTMPFRSMNASNFNVVGSSITFNGTLAFTMTNGNTLVAHLPLQNADGSSIGGSTTRSTVTSTTNYTVIISESSKQLVMDSASDRTFNLPSVGASDVGTYYTFVKVGSGRLTIDAADSDTIADSGAGDTIYDSQAAETYATLTLILATETKWVISGAHGTWVTTD